MSPYTPLKDLTHGRPKNKDEEQIFNWLFQRCEWREGEKTEVKPIVDGYSAAFLAKHNSPISQRTILQTLTSLGFIVSGPNIIGVFLRDSNAVPAPPAPVQPMGAVDFAALISKNNPPPEPEIEEIYPTDPPDVRFEKWQRNERILAQRKQKDERR